MPFVFDPEEELLRPSKRQKLENSSNMARREQQEGHIYSSGSGKRLLKGEQDLRLGIHQQNFEEEFKTSDREELIQCIKRGQRPTWVPKPGLEALCAEVNAEHALRTSSEAHTRPITRVALEPLTTKPLQLSHDLHAQNSVALAFNTSQSKGFKGSDAFTQPPIGIKHNNTPNLDGFEHNHSLSPPSWLTDRPISSLDRANSDPVGLQLSTVGIAQRPRAPSLGSSLSSSFVMRVPTSPLVHSMNNPSLDFSPRDDLLHDTGTTTRAERRRTMPPNVLPSLQMSPINHELDALNRPVPILQRGASMPYQSHQARRSLTSFTYQPTFGTQVALPTRPRKPSQATDASPRHRTSMIGSFEESILRGSMSTAPSKPLDFVAQIGVLGRGKCPPSLKCPAHVSVPFPAVFYNYASTGDSRSISDDSPSPYVGTIDLERNLHLVEQSIEMKPKTEINDPEEFIAKITSPENTTVGRALAHEAQKQKPKSSGGKAPPGGSYRVPQEGQLQIIVKNPNKTAVKFFLVPYNLQGMQPGTKTFVRQRSWSTGPIIDSALSGNPSGTMIQDPLSDKRILRYLIHLKFCCTSKGRFYLYDNMRVMFANRILEGKEKLQNEVQLPEPRYSPYNLGLCSARSESISESFNFKSPPRNSTEEKFMDSVPITGPIGHQFLYMSSPDPFHVVSQPEDFGGSEPVGNYKNGYHLETAQHPESARNQDDRPRSPVTGFELPSTSTRASPVSWDSSMSPLGQRSFSPFPPEAGNGLLSRKLREYNQQNGQVGRDRTGLQHKER